MSLNAEVGVENIVFCVLFIALGLVLVTGRIHMNRWLGFPFYRTYDPRATSERVNRYAATG